MYWLPVEVEDVTACELMVAVTAAEVSRKDSSSTALAISSLSSLSCVLKKPNQTKKKNNKKTKKQTPETKQNTQSLKVADITF